MVPGDEIVGRFVLDEVTNAGSYSTLFRATDKVTGESVALKVMGGLAGSDLVRFSREARVLAELSHPGIVRYISHGVTLQGAPWLAMEWLDGETVGDRIERGPIAHDDALSIAVHVAAALAELHRHGVVHRDVKPANLFLPGRDVARVKVLDLGIARIPNLGRRSPTRIGTILGTPGYMAPEQVRGAAEIGPRADVFALGCVLYECLTGKAAIAGDSVEALLGRTLLEDCPRLRDSLPDTHPRLDDLIARMVARDPADRPPDGDAVVRALEPFARTMPRLSSAPTALAAAASRAVAEFDGKRTAPDADDDPFAAETSPGVEPSSITDEAPTAPPATSPQALSDAERRLLAVVLLSHDAPDSDATLGTLRVAAVSFGAQFEVLWSGVAMAVLRGSGAATDQTARAARCALALRALAPGSSMALATGWGEVAGHGAVGEVIDRAAELLHAGPGQPVARESGELLRTIRLGEVAAGLLDARFEVGTDLAGYALLGEREVVETARPLLGRATPCVGRRRELATLAALLDECIEEPVARAVLVTGPPGSGKSRVRYEFEQFAQGRCPVLEVWTARGDALRAGSPFAVLAAVVRKTAGILASDALPVRRQKLRARVARHVALEDRQRVAEFLGEVVGTSFPDAESVHLRVARLDATLMADQMRRAWEDFVAAECAVRPVLLVIEDLQWADTLSVRYVDAALRAVRERSFLVVAIGRPEVRDAFPALWAERNVQEIRLGELTRRAIEELVRACLGDRVDGAMMARVVERSGGNAFFLEELIRSIAAGRGVGLPGTVLAMVHARLEALDPEARRVMRAASVYGERFWRGAVAALVGDVDLGRTPEWLGSLVDRELSWSW